MAVVTVMNEPYSPRRPLVDRREVRSRLCCRENHRRVAGAQNSRATGAIVLRCLEAC